MMRTTSAYLALALLAFSSGEASAKSPKKPAKDIHEIILKADSLVVRESPMKDAEILFKSNKRDDILSLSNSIDVVVPKPGKWFHCMCIGAPEITLYKHRKPILSLTNHHGRSIRSAIWDSDVEIANADKWIKWFDDRKISFVREEVEEAKAQAFQSSRDWDKWNDSMPVPLRSVYHISKNEIGLTSLEPLAKALEDGIPDQNLRILALLNWFGSGAGPWSGFPSYEEIAEKLLLRYDTKNLLSAVRSVNTSPAQTEGAARLFGGWAFSKERPNDLSQLDPALKAKFWDFTKNTQDKDKLGRAQRAFGLQAH
jgi:hypothetical protein